jgi:hypothetical protein
MLRKAFEMKDLGQTHFFLGLQFNDLLDGIFLYNRTYAKKVLQQFKMGKTHPVTSPMEIKIFK